MTAAHDDQMETKTTGGAPHDLPDFVRYLNVRSASGASFAPDGHRLAFLTDITGVAEVWSVAVTQGTSQPKQQGRATALAGAA